MVPRDRRSSRRPANQAPNLGLYRLVILAPYGADDRALGVPVSLCSPPFRRWSRGSLRTENAPIWSSVLTRTRTRVKEKERRHTNTRRIAATSAFPASRATPAVGIMLDIVPDSRQVATPTDSLLRSRCNDTRAICARCGDTTWNDEFFARRGATIGRR